MVYVLVYIFVTNILLRDDKAICESKCKRNRYRTSQQEQTTYYYFSVLSAIPNDHQQQIEGMQKMFIGKHTGWLKR